MPPKSCSNYEGPYIRDSKSQFFGIPGFQVSWNEESPKRLGFRVQSLG